MKIVRIKLSKEAKEVYDYLNKLAPVSKHERMILKAVIENSDNQNKIVQNSLMDNSKKSIPIKRIIHNYKLELIKINFQYGDPISKDLIPDEYKQNYGATNLFRVELPNYWRMLYTAIDGGSQIEIIAFVLGIMDHKDYN